MKILFASGIFEPESGGPATYVPKLAKLLVEAGHEVKVITYSDKETYDFDSSYPFSVKRIKRASKISNYLRYLLAVIKNISWCDFVYSFDYISAGLPVWLASRLIRKKYVIRVGGDFIWERYLEFEIKSMPLKEFYQRELYKNYPVYFYLIRIVLKGAKAIIFNSRQQRELYQKYYDLDKSRLHTIYNPIPFPKNPPRRTHVDKEIIFAGRFIEMKNNKTVIRAFAKFNNPEFKLILIGDGPQKESMQQLVKDLKIESQVEFMSPIRQKVLWQRIINCYYFIIASWTDVSPNQVYECLALDIPVLLTEENYLSLDTSKWLTLDPHSVTSLAELMDYLTVPQHYHDFTTIQQTASFSHNWSDVMREHIKVWQSL